MEYSTLTNSSLTAQPQPPPQPQPQTQPQPQSIKRKRLTQACDACRKKKVKCSGEKPTCANCKRINIPCTYLPSTKKRGPRVGLVESLEKRLQQMEKLLQPLREQGMIDDKSLGPMPKKPRLSNGATFDIFSANPDNGTTSSSSSERAFIPPVSPPSSKNLSNLDNYNTYQNPIEQTHVWEQPQLNIHNGQLSPSDDISVDNSKIVDESDDNNSTCQEGHKGDPLFFGKTSAHPGFRRPGECAPPEEGNLSVNETSLPNATQSGIFNASMVDQALPYPFEFPREDAYPPNDIMDHLSLCFFNHMIKHTPMFHEPTLKFRLKTRKASPFLVWALCAVAARYSDLQGIAKDPPHSAGDVFAERAISYMAESFDDPNVESVQAILLLCLHSFGSAKGPRSWMYIAMAVRMAQALGMHKEFAAVSCMYAKKGNSHQAFIYREIRRRVFWVCFVIDRFSACALGRPTIIDEGDVEIRQPCDDKERRKEHPAISDMDDRPTESPIRRGRRFILSSSGVFSSLTSVSILLGRVAQYINRMRSADALPVWDSKSEFAQLENQLESWYEILDPNLKWSPEMLKYHVGNGTIGAYAAILTLYHVSIVVLNRPNVATLQTGAAPESQLAFFHISAERCRTSARRTAKIAEALIEAKCTNLCPFTLYPIFATATMHINDTFSNDKTVVETAHKNLNITERYLEMVRPYWNIAGKLIHMLKQMRKCRTEDIMCPESTDSGLMEYWNRTHVSSKPSSKPDTSFQDVMSDSSLVGLSSFMAPEFLSPRFMTTELPDPWMMNFIRSPGITSPRSLVRLRRDPVDDNAVYNNQDDYFAQDMMLYNVVNNQFAFEGLTDPLVTTSLTDLSTMRLYRTPNNLFRQLVDQQGIGGGILKEEITTPNGTNLSAGLASPVIDSLDANFYDNSNLEGEDSRNGNRDKNILPVTL